MPPLPEAETIYALSSGAGRAGVAVVRVSGPATRAALDTLVGSTPLPRQATLRRLRAQLPDGEGATESVAGTSRCRRDGTCEAATCGGRDLTAARVIDRALVLWLPGPASYTGEDMAELHVHGGRAVIDATLAALSAQTGLRLAEPGEFTRRAFLNGKLDLTAAEGIADLIDAETEAQRRQAVRQAGGELAALYEGWRAQLIESMALLEAALDFADEGDVPGDVTAPAWKTLQHLADGIAAHLADGRRGEILRDGFHVVLAGAPNVGKSSLLNALARRDVAIVSPEAGTTRDVIEARLDLGGYPVVLTDTAGVREATGTIEAEGIRRTLMRAGAGDLVLWVTAADEPAAPMPAAIAARGEDVRLLVNKADLTPRALPPDVLAVSAKTGIGIEALVAALADAAKARLADAVMLPPTRARHRQELERCLFALRGAIGGNRAELELRAEDVRIAATALGRITGRVDVEDILDRIFAGFCIGK